jgi:hypothetical protein
LSRSTQVASRPSRRPRPLALQEESREQTRGTGCPGNAGRRSRRTRIVLSRPRRHRGTLSACFNRQRTVRLPTRLIGFSPARRPVWEPCQPYPDALARRRRTGALRVEPPSIIRCSRIPSGRTGSSRADLAHQAGKGAAGKGAAERVLPKGCCRKGAAERVLPRKSAAIIDFPNLTDMPVSRRCRQSLQHSFPVRPPPARVAAATGRDAGLASPR